MSRNKTSRNNDTDGVPAFSVVGAVVPTKGALERGIELVDERDLLCERLREIEEELMQLVSGGQVANLENLSVANGRNGGRKSGANTGKKQQRRGKMKLAIENILKKAGKKGVHIQDLANRLNKDVKAVSAWFTLTGSKNPAIERIERGTYRFNKALAA